MDVPISENGGVANESLFDATGLEDELIQPVHRSVPDPVPQVPQVDDALGRAVGADAAKAVVKLLSRNIRMPWDTNPVLNSKRAFSSFQPKLEQMTVGLKDFIHGSSTVHVAPSSRTPAFQHALKRARLAQCVVSPDDLRYKAISLVKWMLTVDLESTDFGLQVKGAPDEVVNRSIVDSLAAKSTATIYKRARSLWAMFTWIRAHGMGKGLDFQEPQVYEYMCVLWETKRGATSGESLLQAIRFFHALFGLRHFNPLTATSRIRGVAHAMFVTKRCLQQARALYVPELKALERVVLFDDTPHIVICSWLFALLCHGCLQVFRCNVRQRLRIDKV